MDLLPLREKEIFETLKKLKEIHFVVIGGYAVNNYALPRFSVDCDIFIKNKEEQENVQKILFEAGYEKTKTAEDVPYKSNFARYEKNLQNNFKVSVDVLIEKIIDRQSGDSFDADWVFQNS